MGNLSWYQFLGSALYLLSRSDKGNLGNLSCSNYLYRSCILGTRPLTQRAEIKARINPQIQVNVFQIRGGDQVRQRKPITWSVDKNGCWNCTSHSLAAAGYPQFYEPWKKCTPMHRYLYQELFGEIPRNVVVMHNCDNRACLNPEHWEAGTQKKNMQDMVKRGRSMDMAQHVRGEKVNTARLTAIAVLKIRQSDELYAVLAKRYGVEENTISRAKNRISWRHVE